VDHRTVSLTVAEVDAIRSAGRRRLATTATPLVAFGMVNLGGVVACALVGRYHLAPYAVPAFGLAVWLSARALRHRALTVGVQISVRPWALTAAALCVGGVGASRAGDLLSVGVISAVGPFLAQATGLWLLARWADSDALVTTCTLMVLGSALIGSLTSGDQAVALQFGLYGSLLLAAARYVATLSPPG
jgi:hypothetical protein